MIKTARTWEPGMMDDIPILTKDADTGKMHVRIGSCNQQALMIIAEDPERVFTERLARGDIELDIDGHTFYIDAKATAQNIAMQVRVDKSAPNTQYSKYCWLRSNNKNIPARLFFFDECYDQVVNKMLFTTDDVLIASRGEDWYAVTRKEPVYDTTKSITTHRLAATIIREQLAREREEKEWAEAKAKPMMMARTIILSDTFYSRPVQTIVKNLHPRMQEQAECESRAFHSWEYATGIAKEVVEFGPKIEDSPDIYFYFAAYAAMVGTHINAVAKFQGTGPSRVVLFDYWLPVIDAFIDEWNDTKYTPRTRAAFYRYVRSSPFSHKHLAVIAQSLHTAGIVKDTMLFLTAVRNELKAMWEREIGRTCDVCIKTAIQSVLSDPAFSKI